ncbi:hypothetical protein U91I_03954 [alpha proteobacterium U9-1i]|nr:hypothetical protein U91I_03954 [alpha proteobacterium U9-1i]
MQAPLDRAHFSHMTGGDLPLQREILDLFRAQVDGWMALLVPGENWRDAAHTLKGSARGIGLAALAEVCEAVEALANDDAEAATGLLRAALDEALTAVRAYDDELAALTRGAAAR